MLSLPKTNPDTFYIPMGNMKSMSLLKKMQKEGSKVNSN